MNESLGTLSTDVYKGFGNLSADVFKTSGYFAEWDRDAVIDTQHGYCHALQRGHIPLRVDRARPTGADQPQTRGRGW